MNTQQRLLKKSQNILSRLLLLKKITIHQYFLIGVVAVVVVGATVGVINYVKQDIDYYQTSIVNNPSEYPRLCSMLPASVLSGGETSQDIWKLGILTSYLLDEKELLTTYTYDTQIKKNMRKVQARYDLAQNGRYDERTKKFLNQKFNCIIDNNIDVYIHEDLGDFVEFKNTNNIFNVVVPKAIKVENRLLKKIVIPSQSMVTKRMSRLNSRQKNTLCNNVPSDKIDRDTDRLLPLESVWWIQLTLNIVFGMDNDIDGVYGRYTKKIISEFQTQVGNKKTAGVWDKETQKQIKLWMSCI